MKISIIIPVYNSTLYLKECVDSILGQTYQDLEILLVDDGSTDDSPQICDTYAAEDARIKVIHKKNGGTSDARNTGLENATGDYITFMDNDDYWNDPNALQNIVTLIHETDPDVVMHTNMVYWQDKEKPVMPKHMDRKLIAGKNRTEAVEQLIKAGMLTVTVWTKLVKRSLIREHELYFKKGIRNEDTDWIARMLLYAESFDWYDTSFYVYRKGHEMAQTSQKLTYSMVSDLKNILMEYTAYAEENLEESYKKVFFSYLAYPYAVWMGQACLIEQSDALKKDIEEMRRYQYLLKYDLHPAVRLVHGVHRVLGYRLTAKLLMIYIKKVYNL